MNNKKTKNIDFLKYSRQIRYLVFFLTLFMMISAVRVYMGYFDTDYSIKQTQQQIISLQDETSFMRNFLLNYLNSDYSVKFTAHESNITLQNEYVVRFLEQDIQLAQQKQQIQQVGTNEKILFITTPQQAWQYFISNKLSKINF